MCYQDSKSNISYKNEINCLFTHDILSPGFYDNSNNKLGKFSVTTNFFAISIS